MANRLEAPVTFLGRVPEEELSDWLASTDLMVMDCRSRWFGLEQEGFGIVFLNAASCGYRPWRDARAGVTKQWSTV